MTATGKRVHVVQRPDDRDVLGNGPKETWVVGKKRDPVQVDNIHIAGAGRKHTKLRQTRHRKCLHRRIAILQMRIEQSVDFFLLLPLFPFGEQAFEK